MKKQGEKIYILKIHDNNMTDPFVYVSRSRETLVEKAFELVKMSNDEDDEYGWDKSRLEEIHEQLKNTGEFDDDGMTFYVIGEDQMI
ncbi:MAG: hypothetical protein IKD78_04570 [Bacteroidales bacterium]|nr:hypothetical protein [Bacteroidales bacterium]